MAVGLILCRWDDRLGVICEAKYPSNITEGLADEDLLTIFSTHAISEKAGVMAMRIKRVNIMSYYSGLPEGEKTDQFVLALILAPEEDPGPYEEGLVEIAKMIIPVVGKPGFEEFFAESFNRISKYISISEEQRYAFIFRDNTRRLLLERLANGPMTKEGLAKWLSKEVGQEITDIESLLVPLRKTDLIEELNISKGKKVNLEYVFLIRDVAVIRTPHINLFKAAKEGQMAGDLRDKYIDEVTKFFKDYRITGTDSVVISNVISDPDTFDIVRLLRNEYVTRAELTSKIGREIPNLDKVLKKLSDDNIILAIKDKKERVWIILKSDIVFPQFFPEYMVDVIRRRWKEGTIQKEIALKHLEILRAQYIATQAPKFRAKILDTINTIFSNAERMVKKKSWDQAATMLDQVANYTRDMGERKIGEQLDHISKSIREDKEKYVEQTWEQDRVKMLESFKDIAERDKAKMIAAKEGKKKKAAPPPKKTPPPKKKGKKGEEEPEEEPQEEPESYSIASTAPIPKSASASTPSPASTPPPLNVPPNLSRPPTGPSLSPPPSRSPPPSAPEPEPTAEPEAPAPAPQSGDIKELIVAKKEEVKKLSKEGDNLKIGQALSELADLFEKAGSKGDADKIRNKAIQMITTGMKEQEAAFEAQAKKAIKAKNFEEAAKFYDECYQIANKLFKSGMMDYADKAKKYQKAKQECEDKKG